MGWRDGIAVAQSAAEPKWKQAPIVGQSWRDAPITQPVPPGLKPVTDPAILRQLNSDQLPPPPPGYTLDNVPPPPGFMLDAPGASSPIAQAVMPSEPNLVQKTLNGPVRGLTSMFGFPGDVVSAATQPLPSDVQEKLFQGSIFHVLMGDTPTSRSLYNGVEDVLDAPRAALHAAGDFVGSENLRKPFETIGVIPPEGYEGGALDKINQFVYSAAAPEAGAASVGRAVGKASPEIATTLLGLLPKSLVSAVGGGAAAEGAHEVLPDSPTAELVAALFGTLASHGAMSSGSVLTKLLGGVKSYVSQFTPSGQAQAAAARLVEKGVTPEAATKAAEDAKAINDPGDTGYKATTGTLIGEPGAIALEKASVGDPKFSQRIQDNNRAVGANLTQATAPAPGATGADAAQFANDQHAAAIAAHDQRLAQLEAKLNEANNSTAQAQVGVASLGNTKQQASEDLAATLPIE